MTNCHVKGWTTSHEIRDIRFLKRPCLEMLSNGKWGYGLPGEEIHDGLVEWITFLPFLECVLLKRALVPSILISFHRIWSQICLHRTQGTNRMKAVPCWVAVVDLAFPGSCFPFALVSGSSRTTSALLQPLVALTVVESKENICLSVFFARGNPHFLGREEKKSELE